MIRGLELPRLATVCCRPSGRRVDVADGALLLDAVRQLQLPLGQSCDGVGLCGFCRVRVLDGAHHLSAAADPERRILKSLHAADTERLACVARVHGPVTITTSYWG